MCGAAATVVGTANWEQRPPASLLYVDRRVIKHERDLESEVLGAGELQCDRLSGARCQAEALLAVARLVVEIRIRRQGRQNGAGTAQYLDLECVVRGCGRRLGSIDVQPEAEPVRATCYGQSDYLRQRVCVGRAVAVKPGDPAAGLCGSEALLLITPAVADQGAALPV